MAVATALDNLELSEIVGCIAGDDAIFAAARTPEDSVRLQEKIRQIVENGLE